MDTERTWLNFEQGATIGQQGSEMGVIVRDEEHSGGSRITLERATRVSPFAITCGIYGCFFHTRFFGDEAEAQREYEAMKKVLEEIIEGLSRGQLGDKEAEHRSMKLIDEFVERFPT
jgi:hypothetical protein